MSLPVLPFALKMKNTILAHTLFNSLIDEIYSLISTIPHIDKLKGDLELLTLICNIVENHLGKNKQELDKKNIVIAIEDRLFNLNDDEKKCVAEQIDFLHNNGKIIKQKTFKLIGRYMKDWIFRKCG